eukprot:2910023-Rhodomonas_salina.6
MLVPCAHIPRSRAQDQAVPRSRARTPALFCLSLWDCVCGVGWGGFGGGEAVCVRGWSVDGHSKGVRMRIQRRVLTGRYTATRPPLC